MVSILENGKQTIKVIFDERAPAGMPIMVGIDDGSYWADVLEADFGVGVRFRGIGPSWEVSDECRAGYDVHLGDLANACECKGFLRHGHCKHIVAAVRLQEAGLLRPSPRPEEAVEMPAKCNSIPF